MCLGNRVGYEAGLFGIDISIFRARDLVDTLLTDEAALECGAGVTVSIFQ